MFWPCCRTVCARRWNSTGSFTTLHGPDLMFYYKALQSNPVNRLGNAMHEQKGEVFFTRARTVVENAPDKDAALAYTLGFVLSLIHI